MSSIHYLFVFLLITFLTSAGYSQGKPQNDYTFEYKYLKFGENNVGFSSVIQYDNTRPPIPEVEGPGRHLQINIWYPIDKPGNEKLLLQDYILLKNSEFETHSGKDSTNYLKYFEWPLYLGVEDKLILDYLKKSHTMNAFTDGVLATGNHPVVLLMHGSAADYMFLAEYLASYGYIAVNVPTYGYASQNLDINSIGVETQVRDYEFALSFLRKKFSRSFDTKGVVGFSFGGQSAVVFAMRTTGVNAVVSLDGGIGSRFGDRMVRESIHYTSEKINFALLHLYNQDEQQNYLAGIQSYIFSDRILTAINNVAHWHFTSFGLLNNYIPGLFREIESNDAFEMILLKTKWFLDGHLKSNLKSDTLKTWAEPYIESEKIYMAIE